MNLIVPFGKVKFVFYDDLNYPDYLKKQLVLKIIRGSVPPGIWFGFMGKDKSKANYKYCKY